MIRILIVDDHPVARWGFRQMLATDPEMQLLGEIADGMELLERVAEFQPDVVLLDIRMPGLSGLDVVAELRRRCPGARILILTVFDDEDRLYAALAAGVDGYLLKTASRDTLLQSIRSVHRGRRVVDPSLIHLVLDRFADLVRGQDSPRAALTETERRLLGLLAAGTTAAAIAGELHWSVATVGRRIHQVCEKLGVENRAQAVREATRLNLV